MARTALWEVFGASMRLAARGASWDDMGSNDAAPWCKSYEEALRQHNQGLKKIQMRQKRKTQGGEQHDDQQKPTKKKKRKPDAAEQKKPPPEKGVALECAMVEESVPGGIEWVEGRVLSVNMGKKTLKVRVTTGKDEWSLLSLSLHPRVLRFAPLFTSALLFDSSKNVLIQSTARAQHDAPRNEKYKFNDEGTEWRWPLHSSAADEHAVTSVESASASAAAAAAKPAPATIAAPEAQKGEEEKASSAAVAACTGRAAQKRAADAGAKDCVVSGCLLKAGAVIECAYDNEQGGEIEWICGTGKTCRALMWHASSHVAYLQSVFLLPAVMVQHSKHEGHEHPPAHTCARKTSSLSH